MGGARAAEVDEAAKLIVGALASDAHCRRVARRYAGEEQRLTLVARHRKGAVAQGLYGDLDEILPRAAIAVA